jgi:chemotaxis protein methyltransferase CheR
VAADVQIEPIDDREFRALSAWIHAQAGIAMSERKKALMMGRLGTRLRHHGLSRYGAYYELLRGGRHPQEAQIAVDLLTTNETHFFREPRHFDFLRDRVIPEHQASRPLRVWSAACSSGEEPYSIAMVLASAGRPWEVLASDLSSRVLERARTALYAMDRARTIPREHLHAHCLKGTGRHDGTFLLAPHVTQRVRFSQINLNRPLPAVGEFDVIFLRNVMIYFDPVTKQQVLERVLACLRPGGYFMPGHSENLAGCRVPTQSVAPAIYRKLPA